MKKIDVIIFGGQSNMQGQAEVLSEAQVVPCAYEYRWLEDELVPLKNPVGENIRYDGLAGKPVTEQTSLSEWLHTHAMGSACYGHTSLIPAFCRAYLAETETAVVAVPVAKGSTEIKDWLPNTVGYGMMVEKSAAAIRKAKEEYDVDKIFFVWLQGESDAVFSNSQGYYREMLTLLGDALRTDLDIHRFGVIRVGRFTNDGRDEEIISAQDAVCAENPLFLMLTRMATELNQEPDCMNPFVGGHFSAKGLERLGGAAGRSLGQYRRLNE